MSLDYVPPPIIYNVEGSRAYCGTPYFFVCGKKILNLAAATEFYVDHIPLTHYYWPCVRISGHSYELTESMGSEEEAMEFLKELTTKIESVPQQGQ